MPVEVMQSFRNLKFLIKISVSTYPSFLKLKKTKALTYLNHFNHSQHAKRYRYLQHSSNLSSFPARDHGMAKTINLILSNVKQMQAAQKSRNHESFGLIPYWPNELAYYFVLLLRLLLCLLKTNFVRLYSLKNLKHT